MNSVIEKGTNATSTISNAGAVRALSLELKSLQKSPIEGFTVTASDDNIFVWTVGIFGPPGTLYQVLMLFIIYLSVVQELVLFQQRCFYLFF